MKTGTIFNIQKFCINDGPGIRTTVFLKGCPLNCLWCHNPESKAAYPEILYNNAKCIRCGACAAICPEQRHSIADGIHTLERNGCKRCGKCTDICMTGALETAGYSVTTDEVLKKVMQDAIFYQNSGGGMTLSGGEPMAQFSFIKELITKAKENGLHTCMETCGYAPWELYREIAPLIDIFLFDYKLTDPDLHKQYTGVSNELILENLHRLDEIGSSIVLRCPIIPTINDTEDHFKGIAETANKLQHIIEINIEPYHPMGNGKASMLDRTYELEHLTFPENDTVARWIETIQAQTNISVKKA